MKKDWKCNNKCGSNCCSEIFLPLSKDQKELLELNGEYIVDNKYADFRWLGFYKGIEVKKLKNGWRLIKVVSPYEIKYHKFLLKHMLYIEGKCDKLLKNDKCKIFRNRPQTCKVSLCAVFEKDNKINWYADNGLLKEQRDLFKQGVIND